MNNTMWFRESAKFEEVLLVCPRELVVDVSHLHQEDFEIPEV